MLNTAVGTIEEIEGRLCLRTREGAIGHAHFGPYEARTPGRYVVEFLIRASDPDPAAPDRLCAAIDVTSDQGKRQLALGFVFSSTLADGFARIPLAFELNGPGELEYRVHVNGALSLDVADHPLVTELPGDNTANGSIAEDVGLPEVIRHNQAVIKLLSDRSVLFTRDHDRLVGRLQGINFSATRYDDINFVDELFFKNAYNFISQHDTCVIDVGMNVGLASLLFAAKPSVVEVHAFEPFPTTYARGLANLQLNPELAAKIKTNNFGLADKDETATFFVPDTGGDSGAQATRNVEGGLPVTMSIRDAASVLAPIIHSAKARGLRVIAKIDCEGAEFAIFQSLTDAGLLGMIDAFMVEWHRVFPGRTQQDLIQPLLDHQFLVIDLTPPEGNGFFYAAHIR